MYRTRKNRSYCIDHEIRLSGPKLGRPSAESEANKKQEYQDNSERIEVERYFSRSRRCYGMGGSS
ncbi:MAG: transposase [Clostridium sp.]|uniref:transposase n=1 Tax=Eisenbergiella porci TaxID=2652274 RepID=UPI000C83EC67|nr:transposase [Clostridium sp.]